MSLTKVTYSMIDGSVLNVQDFGAKGDGVTDDTVAIQTAVNTSSGKTLVFPAGTYLISASINLKSNVTILGEQNNTVIKIANGNYAAGTRVFVSTDGDGAGAKNNITLNGLIIDGNKGNIGTARGSIITFFKGSNYSVLNCRFQNCEGICLNISTINENVTIANTQFINCGGAPDNSDGYRRQAIAFSNTTGVNATRTKSVLITNCLFDTQGFDCISLGNCDDIVVSSNIAKDSYSFLYTVANPYSNTNLTVCNNAIYNVNQGAYVTVTRPVAIDLPALDGGSILNNVINGCAQAGIGVFGYSKNIVVSGNTLIDVVKTPSSWIGGISVGTGDADTKPENVLVIGNTIKNTQGGVTMPYGLFVRDDCTNVYVADNVFIGATTSKFGYYASGDPSVVNSFPLTDNIPLGSSICIIDADPSSGVVTNWRKHNTLTSYSVNGVQVVGAQQTAIPDAAGGTEIATINSILGVLRTHGLIDT